MRPVRIVIGVAAMLAGVAVVPLGPARADGLWTDGPEYSFSCDGGASRYLGTLFGANPGEWVTFSSPELGALLGGAADGAGTISLIWQCNPDESGPWHIDAFATSSGRSTNFTVNSVNPYATSEATTTAGEEAGTPPTCDPRPSGDVPEPAAPAAPQPKHHRDYYGGYPVDWAKASAALLYLSGVDSEAGRLGEVFLGEEENDEQTVSLADLLWEERGIWSRLEGQLQDSASAALTDALSTAANSCHTIPLPTSWIADMAATGTAKWETMLHALNVMVAGDVWIGPAGADGVRPVQLRYKVFLSDVYDFELGKPGASGVATDAMYRLWDHGFADEFAVTGSGVSTRIFEYDSNSDLSTIGLNW